MNCPSCDTEMKRGVLTMRKPFLKFLAFGFGTRNVYFSSEDTGSEQLVFDWSKKARAYNCPNSKIVVFPEAK